MIKKYLILLIMFLICYNSYAYLNNNNLREKYIGSEVYFDNVTVEEAFKIISQDSGVSFFTDSDVKNIMLNIKFEEGINFSEVVEEICKTYNLKIDRIKDVYVISKKKNLNNKFSIYGKIISKDYNTPIDDVKISVANGTNSIFYSDHNGEYVIFNIEPGVYILQFQKQGYVTKHELINLKEKTTILNVNLEKDNKIIPKNLLKREIKSESELIKNNNFITKKVMLNNLEAKELKKVLEHNYEERLRTSILPKQNIIIVSGDNILVKDALNFIKELDDSIKQVRISAQILDVTNNLFENLGFNWAYNSNKLNSNTSSKDLSIGVLNNNSIIGIGQVYNSSVNIIRQFNSGNDILNLGVNILESTQDLVVSARPSILVVNGQEGSFKVTEEVIVGNKRYENNNNDSVTFTPIFKEAGIILKVKPHIKSKDEIILDTLIEVSNFKLKKQGDNLENQGTFNSEGGSKVGRSIKTTIKIKDGQTIFIGGLKKAIVHNLDSKIPFFGTIPMIKFLFKNEHVNHEMSDVYIKLKVDIVEDEYCDFDRSELHQKVSEIVNNKIY